MESLTYRTHLELENLLNRYGCESWEVIYIKENNLFEYNKNNTVTILFKRKKQ